jgi:transcriptional regulator with XRE-family HTH domain
MALNIAERQILSTGNRTVPVSTGIAAWQPDDVSFGERLREARKARGLTALDLQERTGIDNSSISRWETGKRAPRGAYVTKLARELEVTERWLMTGEGTRDPVKLSADPPIGPSGLESVLYSYDWPEDVPIEVADDVISALRDESRSLDGQNRPASAWKLRLRQLLRERLGGRPRRAAGSGRL